VTRLKDNIRYGVVQRRPVRPGSEIRRDEVVLLERIQEAGPVALMRRIEIWVEDRQETMVLLTNHLRLAASTVAAVYRERWQVEQFFRALKQSLRIKTFVGTSANAVLVQIWTARIAMLLLRWLQMRSSFGWSLSNLVALLRQQLFVYRDLLVWLDHPFKPDSHRNRRAQQRAHPPPALLGRVGAARQKQHHRDHVQRQQDLDADPDVPARRCALHLCHEVVRPCHGGQQRRPHGGAPPPPHCAPEQQRKDQNGQRQVQIQNRVIHMLGICLSSLY
jgi:hypothetical protein